MNWKRLFFLPITVLLVALMFLIQVHLAYFDLKALTEKAVAQNIELSNILLDQKQLLREAEIKIAGQQAVIDTYEKLLGRRPGQTAFSQEEALDFVQGCIGVHESYYDWTKCNLSTGLPPYHREINAKYLKLLEYIKLK